MPQIYGDTEEVRQQKESYRFLLKINEFIIINISIDSLIKKTNFPIFFLFGPIFIFPNICGLSSDFFYDFRLLTVI